MKLLLNLILMGLSALLLLTGASTFAQTPKVPITYAGDTAETIDRRAQWIEGAKNEGRLSWWGTTRPNQAVKVIAEFNKIYPFIEVNYWRGSTELRSKLEAGFLSGRIDCDVAAGGEPYNYPRWRKMGFLEKFTHLVPGIKKIPKGLHGKYGDWFTPGNSVSTPQYNTNLVSAAEAPKNWEDLLDSKWKGQIGMTINFRNWTVLALAEGGWGIEKTEEFLYKLKKQEIIWQRGYTAGQILMIAGEFKIFADGYMHHVLRAQEENAPVGWVKARPMTVTGPSFTMPSQAPHPNAARLFLEWLLSPRGLMAYENATYFGAVYPGSPTRIGKFVEGFEMIYRTEEVVKQITDLGLVKRFSQIFGIQ